MTTIRSKVESLFLQEMLQEDATYLIMNDEEDDVDAVLANTSNGLFDSTSSNEDPYEEDDEIDDEEEGDEDYDSYE